MVWQESNAGMKGLQRQGWLLTKQLPQRVCTSAGVRLSTSRLFSVSIWPWSASVTSMLGLGGTAVGAWALPGLCTSMLLLPGLM